MANLIMQLNKIQSNNYSLGDNHKKMHNMQILLSLIFLIVIIAKIMIYYKSFDKNHIFV